MTTRPPVYRQDVTLTLSVLVSGGEEDFDEDRGVVAERIERYVRALLPERIREATKDLYAGRGPGGSRYYHPEEEERPTVGIRVTMARLKERSTVAQPATSVTHKETA